MIQRPTPPAFRANVTNATVPMLPLGLNPTAASRPGWCTYTDGFDQNPDIEVFCGGENEKSALAAACWRQGNLLHFGFELSPAEMNPAGRHLLLNCIAYISRFTEDRPIAVTPSVFGGPTALPRTYLDRRLGKHGDLSEVTWILGDPALAPLKDLPPEQVRAWFLEHRAFLHPAADKKLVIDAEAQALNVPIDRLEFFERTFAALSSNAGEKEKARTLLQRYAPGLVAADASVEAWRKWLSENRDYLFFSDQGDYRWYIDPLAKKRGIPSAKLRGATRASTP